MWMPTTSPMATRFSQGSPLEGVSVMTCDSLHSMATGDSATRMTGMLRHGAAVRPAASNSSTSGG